MESSPSSSSPPQVAASSARRRRAPSVPGRVPFASLDCHALEPRVLLAVAHPTPVPPWLQAVPDDAYEYSAGDEPRFASIPSLNSRPGAGALLYLDFDGDPASNWSGTSVTATPRYDRDSDPGTFSTEEIDDIREIWAAVAEKFSPFDLNVTTVKPAALDNKVALRAVIGGDGEWTGGSYAGIAYVGSFYNSLPNTVYVFPEHLAGGHPAYVAEAIAHESGHGFGLEHQSEWSVSGVLVEEYYAGDGAAAPIMGASYDERGIWWQGRTPDGFTSNQNDLAVIAGSKNGFGYRSDDHGDNLNYPTPLSIVGDQGNGAGVIEKGDDKDYFSFVTGSGNVTIVVSAAAFGAMLDHTVYLFDHDGAIVATANTQLHSETISLYLDAGAYRLGVHGAGNYIGDVGQYTISASLITPAVTIPAPTDLTWLPLPADGGVQLWWTDNATTELGYYVQRSTDGGTTWRDHAVTAPDANTFADAGARAGGTYLYRLYAFDDTAVSPTTSAMTVMLPPNVPTGITATAASSRRIRVGWTAVNGASTYVIERTKNADDTTWKIVGIVGGARTTFDDTGLNPGVSYEYRVRAANAAGITPVSASIGATTPAETSAPDAPSKLSAVRKSSVTVRLSWQDNSDDEVGFRIQWTAPRRKWETLGTVAADKTSITLYLWRDDASFRVAAYNKQGVSTYTDDKPIVSAAKRPSAATVPLATNLFSSRRIARKALASLFSGKPTLLA